MKNTLLLKILYCYCLFSSCTNNKVGSGSTPLGKKMLLIHIQDFTKSTNILHYCDSNTVKNIYYSIASKNEGEIKLIGIYDNSLNQEIRSITIPRLDTVDASTIKNIYQLSKAKIKNTHTRHVFDSLSEPNLKLYQSFVTQPKSYLYSDLTGALKLAKDVSEQVNFEDFDTYILLCSDLINDPKTKRFKPLQPVYFPNRVKVLLIRPSLSTEEISTIFPKTTVFSFSDSKDAISFLTKK